MLGLLRQNLNEWREISRLDDTYRSYSTVSADVLLMYGGRSDSDAVDLVVERLPLVLPHCEILCFPRLDHFGIERTAPEAVAAAVRDFFLVAKGRTAELTTAGRSGISSMQSQPRDIPEVVGVESPQRALPSDRARGHRHVDLAPPRSPHTSIEIRGHAGFVGTEGNAVRGR